MIKRTNVWVWSYNINNKPKDVSSEGKWLIEGEVEEFKRIFPYIDFLVDKGTIYRAKYTHKECPAEDPLPLSSPILCVYADDKTKDRVKIELLNLGLKPEVWKYEKDTRKDWEVGGELRERSKLEKMVQAFEADAFKL
jgi:hypothetical protein